MESDTVSIDGVKAILLPGVHSRGCRVPEGGFYTMVSASTAVYDLKTDNSNRIII